MLSALLQGPPAYAPRTGWPAWAVLPAALVILVLAAIVGGFTAWGYSHVAGLGLPSPAVEAAPTGQMMVQLAAWIAGLQIASVLLTLLAAGFFSSDRTAALSLERPAGGWRVLPAALLPIFVATGLWTTLLLLVKPDVVIHDLRPFQELLHSDALWLVLFVICIGAPLSEELLFRGFVFSGLAKSRLGFMGTGILTSLLWASLHAGYSIFGLIEVLAIGLYLAWLLVRTGSLWVTIFCHAVYNTAVALTLLYVTLPAPA